MANFPNSPITNDTYVLGGVTYIYDGTAWKVQPASAVVTTVALGGTGQTTEAEALGEMTQALTEDTAPDWTADYVMTYDASADTGKKVLGSNIAPYIFKNLSTDISGTNGASAQAWFEGDSNLGDVTVAANTTYRFFGLLHISRSAGTTSHTTAIRMGNGTATLASVRGVCNCNSLDTSASGAVNSVLIEAGNTSYVCKAASTSATEQIYLTVEGTARFTTGGTWIPSFIYSVAPGGTPTIKANSFFEMIPIGTDVVQSAGTWS